MISTPIKDKEIIPATDETQNPPAQSVENSQNLKEESKNRKTRVKSEIPKKNPFEKTVDDSLNIIDKILQEEV